MSSRTKNSIRNINYSIIGQVLTHLANFSSRTIFIQVLSAEYLGLTGLFTNMLSILSLAELGVGAAITYSLYKPIAENNKSMIEGLMNLFKKTYIMIGITILIIGISLTPFLTFFISDIPNIPNIYLIYIIYVLNSSSTYFYSYKRAFLIADQKKHIDSLYHYSFLLLRIILQIFILIITKNFLLYLFIQLLLTVIENIAISYKVNKMYPMLDFNSEVKLPTHEKNKIIDNVKAMSGHKLGGVIVNGTDNMIISMFIGLVEVGLYSNYNLVILALKQGFRILFDSLTASIGNLGVTDSKERSRFIFECVDLIGFWLSTFSVTSLLILFNPFIILWLGEEYIFDISIVILIVINFYLAVRRYSVLAFRDAFGLFWHDRFKPIFEASINIIASLLLVNFFGISGVIMGTILSTILVNLWIEPLVLYKYGFNSSSKKYFLTYLFYSVIMIMISLITFSITSMLPDYSLIGFIGKMFICLIVPNLLMLFIFWNTEQFQYLKKIFKPKLVK